jgi:molybdopterin molybdotransferase
VNQSSTDQPKDVRMRGFQSRAEVAIVQALLAHRLASLPAEKVDLADAAERVLAEDVTAPCNVPAFARAAMDGYALRGRETFGAGPYNPLEFSIVGESLPGRPFPGETGPGQALRIMTGAPIPAGADSVLQAEAAEEIRNGAAVRVTEAVPPGRHVGQPGEDIEAGQVVVSAGRILRPQDLGVLASVGASPVAVVRRPSLAILVTGDELLPCGSRPEGFFIVDSNSVMLAALARRDGSSPPRILMVRDQFEGIRAALAEATEDVVLITGGSSVGKEDHAPRVLAELGELCVHGVALRPASPSGLGFVGRRPVFLLPGNPVSCLCAYDLFAGPAVRRLGGRSPELPYRAETLTLARKITSAVGRLDYVRVQVSSKLEVEPVATSGAAILSSTTRADGFVLVPPESEGFALGERVRVYFYA